MRPHSDYEVKRWTVHRRPHEREKPPVPGERVLFREVLFGPAVPAVVVAVQDMETPGDHWAQHGGLVATQGNGIPDPSVWAFDPQSGRHRLHRDPWPWTWVSVVTGVNDDGTDKLAPPRWCKEARVRGSAGWLREGSRAHTGNYREG